MDQREKENTKGRLKDIASEIWHIANMDDEEQDGDDLTHAENLAEDAKEQIAELKNS